MNDIITEPDERISPCFEFFRGRGSTHRPGLLFFFHHFDRDFTGIVRPGAARWINHGYDLVQVQCWKCDSFLTIPDEEIAAAREFALSRGYQTLLGSGASMGGFGAILLSADLGLDRVLSFAPRWAMIDDNSNQIVNAGVAELEALAERKGRSLARTGPNTDLIVVSDPCDATDTPVVTHLRKHIPKDQLRLLPVRHAGHFVTGPLTELKLHPDETSALLQDGDLARLRRRIVRSGSKSMMLGLARFLAMNDRLTWAANIYERPICHVGQDRSSNQRDRYAILARLGRKEDLARALISTDAEEICKSITGPDSLCVIEAAVDVLPDDVLSMHLEAWCRLKPITPWRALRFGEQARALGKLASAKVLLSGRCHPQDPPQRPALVLLAEILLDLGQPYEALVSLRDWIGQDPTADPGWALLRTIRETHKQLVAAERHQQALEAVDLFLHYRDDGWMHLHRAQHLAGLDRPEEALAALMAARTCLPDNPAMDEASGRLLARLAKAVPDLAVSNAAKGGVGH